ncbi:MAG: monooxygenase [Hyphomicrobiaceae bacterium]|nr:monooxygenase [Hyphomicrobiaceae bacterium]
MITAIVRFKLPDAVNLADAKKMFEGSAPKYVGLAGLVRKYYLFDAASHTGGGVYLWESREAAEKVYNADWKKMIADRYGAAPDISYFESPVIVDNDRPMAQAAE